MHDDYWCRLDPCPTCIDEQEEKEEVKRQEAEEIMKKFDGLVELFKK